MRNQIETIYIVDDDPIIIYSMTRLMKETNFYKTLFTFENGKKAITALQSANQLGTNLPNIIFLDLSMPEMNGWEFLSEFAKIDFQKSLIQQIRIITISSSVNPSDIEKINSHPLVEKYIVKPLTPSDLLQLLEN